MKLIRIRVGAGLSDLDKDIHQSFNDMMQLFNPFVTYQERNWRPNIDICEDKEGFLVMVELAGVEVADIDLEIDGRTLRLSGRRQRRDFPKETRYHLAEIPYGSFERIFSLPAVIDASSVEAIHQQGILEIRMAVLSKKHTAQRVPIVGR